MSGLVGLAGPAGPGFADMAVFAALECPASLASLVGVANLAGWHDLLSWPIRLALLDLVAGLAVVPVTFEFLHLGTYGSFHAS